MATISHGRNAVLIVRTTPGWKPASLNAIPPTVVSSTFYARRKPLYAALEIADAYNRQRLPGTGTFDSTWALCIVAVGQRGALRRLARVSRNGGGN